MQVENRLRQIFFSLYKNNKFQIIITVLLIATVLRIFQINNRPLWYDELQSVTHASLPFRDIFFSTLRYDPHPPLHILQLSFWLMLGTDDAWIRMNSVLWSLLTFIPLYLLGRRLFNQTCALISIFVFAISPMAIFYAQEVRPYAMQIFLITLSIYLLEISIDNQHNKKYISIFSVSFLLTLYSQGASFLLLIPFSLYTIMRLGGIRQSFAPQNRPILISEFIVFILTLPWILVASKTSVGHLISPNLVQVAYDITALLLGPNHQLNTLLSCILILTIAFCLLSSNEIRKFAFCFVIIPIFTAFFISIAVRPIWHIRLIAVCLTPIILAIGFSAAWLKIRFYQSQYIMLSMLAVITLAILPLSLTVNRNTLDRSAYFDAAKFLLERTEAGETIVFQHQRDAWGVSWYFAGPGKLRTVATKQEVKASSGQIILYGYDVDNDVTANVRVLRAEGENSSGNAVKFGQLILEFSEVGPVIKGTSANHAFRPCLSGARLQ